MKIRYLGIAMLVTVLMSTTITSCREEWDAHYATLPADKSDLNLYDFIKSQSDLSTFTKMLETSGYDSILSKPQTFTVWAPSNDALSGLNTSDPLLAMEIVKNHITRFSYTTSGIARSTMLMLNSKLIPFEKLADGYYFNEKKIIKTDLAAANGILHVIGEYAPYKKNIWEYINTAKGLDSLKMYINSLTRREFDMDASYKDGVFKDSIFKTTNPVLTRLASLDAEDSLYTALLPDNQAWTMAYNKIFPFFNTTSTDGGVRQQRTSTMWTLIKDLFFRNKIKVPSTLNPLESTSETKFYNPDYLFSGSQPVVMSNGLSYVISSWQIPDTVSWFKPIRIEAENSFGRTVSNLGTSVNSGLGTGMTVSNNYYLVLRDAALSQLSRLYVTYSIPGTLSARYNIYCTFVPKSILDPNDKKPYQVKFYLTYTNSSGQQVANAAIGAANNVLKPSDPAAVFTTDPTKIHKMLVVKDFTFPYSNAVFSANTATELIKQIKVSLRIESVNTKEKDDILIDCIILEPVLQ